MKKFVHGTLLLCCLSPFVGAQANTLESSVNVNLVNKYMWRGWTLNENKSIQGGFDLSYGNAYAGVFGASDQEYGTEMDYYVGYGFDLAEDFNLNFEFIRYDYADSGFHLDELSAALSYQNYTVKYNSGEDGYTYLEGEASFELTDKWGVSVHVGLEDYDNEDGQSVDWLDANFMFNYTISDNYSAYIGYSDKENFDSQIMFGLSAEF
jgi:uncharacterized protein (TIGR02001 family)